VTIPEGAPGVFGPLARRGREKLVSIVTLPELAAYGLKTAGRPAGRSACRLR
jgi:hypothetical protein